MKCYAGFVNGKIATISSCTEEGDWYAPEIFSKRKWAEVYFDDVRLVEIKEVEK